MLTIFSQSTVDFFDYVDLKKAYPFWARMLLNKNFLPKNLMPLTKVSKIKRRFLPCTILGNFCGQDLGLYFWFFFHRKLIYFWMELQNCNIRSFFHSISVLAFNFSVKMSLFIFFNEWKIIIPFCQGWPRIGASIKSFDWDSWMPAKFSNKTQCQKSFQANVVSFI